jgi:hypothetical protein
MMDNAQLPCGRASASSAARRPLSGHDIIMRLGSTDEKVLESACGELERSGLNNLDSLLEVARIDRERRRSVYRGLRLAMAAVVFFFLVLSFAPFGNMNLLGGGTILAGYMAAGLILSLGSMQQSTCADSGRRTFERGMAVALKRFDQRTVHQGLVAYYNRYCGARRTRLYKELDRYGQVENLDAVSADHIIAILNVLRQRDDVRAAHHIESMMRYVQPERVQQAASECLAHIRECAREPRASAILLRAASEPIARTELLRAAAPGAEREPEQLLRAVVAEEQPH